MSRNSEGVNIPRPGKEMGRKAREKPNRHPYVVKACNECRRRKLKCDGDKPCHRCTTYSVACEYNPVSRKKVNYESDEFRDVNSRLSELQRQIDSLSSRADASGLQPNMSPAPLLGQEDTNYGLTEREIASSESSDQSRPYRGPTSAEFTLKVATGGLGSLHQLPRDPSNAEAGSFEINTTSDSEFLADCKPLAKLLFNDPLQEVKWGEVSRLISVFNNGPGLIYPIISTTELLKTSERLFHALDRAKGIHSMEARIAAAEELTSAATITLKLVVANALTLENCQMNSLGQRIFDSIREPLGSSFWGLPDLRKIINWTLVALLHFHLDEELQASRVVAHAARLCLEMGINRKDVHAAFKNPGDAVCATKLLWTVFALDRRSSIALGIPFVIQDRDLDMSWVVHDSDRLYLQTVVSLSRIAGEACLVTSRLSDKTAKIDLSEIDYLDYQVAQWERRIPPEFQFKLTDVSSEHSVPEAGSLRLLRNVILFLRGNQLRNLIYRPILYTTERLAAHRGHAYTAIDIAREALQVLHELSRATVILQTQPVFFKYFLVSAFSVLMLAVAKSSSAETFSANGREPRLAVYLQKEFYIALDLFQLMSSRCPAMMRIWKYVSGLESVATRMGLPARSPINGSHNNVLQSTVEPLQSRFQAQSPSVDRQWLSPGSQQLHLEGLGAMHSNAQLANELSSLLDTTHNLAVPMMFDSAFDPFSLDMEISTNE